MTRLSTVRQAAEELKAIRIALSMTLAETATTAGIAYQTLTGLETHRRHPSLAAFLAWTDALGVDVVLSPRPATTVALANAADHERLRTRTLERMASGEAKRIRIDAGVSRTALAEALGCTPNAVGRWETAEPHRTPDRLLLAYGRQLDALACGTGLKHDRRPLGHDSLGVRLDNLLGRRSETAADWFAMTDEQLLQIPGLGAAGVRRVREHQEDAVDA